MKLYLVTKQLSRVFFICEHLIQHNGCWCVSFAFKSYLHISIDIHNVRLQQTCETIATDSFINHLTRILINYDNYIFLMIAQPDNWYFTKYEIFTSHSITIFPVSNEAFVYIHIEQTQMTEYNYCLHLVKECIVPLSKWNCICCPNNWIESFIDIHLWALNSA